MVGRIFCGGFVRLHVSDGCSIHVSCRCLFDLGLCQLLQSVVATIADEFQSCHVRTQYPLYALGQTDAETNSFCIVWNGIYLVSHCMVASHDETIAQRWLAVVRRPIARYDCVLLSQSVLVLENHRHIVCRILETTRRNGEKRRMTTMLSFVRGQSF